MGMLKRALSPTSSDKGEIKAYDEMREHRPQVEAYNQYIGRNPDLARPSGAGSHIGESNPILDHDASDSKPRLALQADGSLDISLPSEDPRTAIVVRNRRESPLLCLPAEIRNQILSLAISNMHIHISREPLSHSFPPGTPTLSSGSTLKDELDPYEPEKEWDRTNPTRFYNNVYPRDLASWYKYYTTRPVRLSAIDMFYQTADNKYVKASGMNFKNIAATCRQLYAEIGVLPYLTNAFSFDSPYTFFHWLHHRLPCQRAALRELWGDVAWSHELQNQPTIAGVFKDINVEECKLFISTVALERPMVRLVNRSSVLQATNKLAWSYRKRNLLIYLHRRLFGEDPETNPGAGEIEVVFVREIWGFLDYD